jgi:hypothetical protein
MPASRTRVALSYGISFSPTWMSIGGKPCMSAKIAEHRRGGQHRQDSPLPSIRTFADLLTGPSVCALQKRRRLESGQPQAKSGAIQTRSAKLSSRAAVVTATARFPPTESPSTTSVLGPRSPCETSQR